MGDPRYLPYGYNLPLPPFLGLTGQRPTGGFANHGMIGKLGESHASQPTLQLPSIVAGPLLTSPYDDAQHRGLRVIPYGQRPNLADTSNPVGGFGQPSPPKPGTGKVPSKVSVKRTKVPPGHLLLHPAGVPDDPSEIKYVEIVAKGAKLRLSRGKTGVYYREGRSRDGDGRLRSHGIHIACTVCQEVFDQKRAGDALKHFITEHPNAPEFAIACDLFEQSNQSVPRVRRKK